MKLLIDSGNTRVKFALVNNDASIIRVDRCQAAKNLPLVTRIICSAVSTHQDYVEILEQAKLLNIDTYQVKTSASFLGIECGYPKPENLGVDRWLAVIGASQLYPDQDVVIVDAGTAMTVDLLTSSKKHLGGWILPGLQLMKRAITEKAPGVFAGEIEKAERIGTDTPSALHHGCLYGLLGAVEKAFLELQTLHPKRAAPTLVLTGGDATILSAYMALPHQVIDNLVFYGMREF